MPWRAMMQHAGKQVAPNLHSLTCMMGVMMHAADVYYMCHIAL